MAATRGDEGGQAYRAIGRRHDATGERFGLGNGRKGHRFDDRATDHVLSAQAPETWSVFVESLRQLGLVEGENLTFERRYAENRLDRLPELAAELVRLKIDVIVALGTLAPLAAK